MATRAILLLTLATVMPTTEIPCVVDTHLERECTERTMHATRTYHAPKSRNCLRSFPHTVTADAETGSVGIEPSTTIQPCGKSTGEWRPECDLCVLCESAVWSQHGALRDAMVTLEPRSHESCTRTRRAAHANRLPAILATVECKLRVATSAAVPCGDCCVIASHPCGDCRVTASHPCGDR